MQAEGLAENDKLDEAQFLVDSLEQKRQALETATENIRSWRDENTKTVCVISGNIIMNIAAAPNHQCGRQYNGFLKARKVLENLQKQGYGKEKEEEENWRQPRRRRNSIRLDSRQC